MAGAHRIERLDVEGHAAHALVCPGAGTRAVVVPGLAMLGASLTYHGTEVLGRRGGVAAYAASGSTMGIPLLYPFANRLSGDIFRVGGREVALPPRSPLVRRDPAGLPIHGVRLAGAGWRVTIAEADEDAARVGAELEWAAHPDLLALFPAPHVVDVVMSLSGARLTVTTGVAATGDVPVPISFGHHPYVTLPGVPRGAWEVRLPVTRRAELDARGIPTGAEEPAGGLDGPLGGRALDDLFTGLSDPPEFSLTGGGRRVAVTLLEGYPVAQAYAPPSDPLVAFEPMTAPVDALRSGRGLRHVPPGGRFRAAFRVSVGEAP